MTSRRRFLTGAAIASVAVGTVGATASGSAAAADAPTSVDIGFCTDMAAHHVQALAMCQRVIGRDTGDAVQAAAAEVLQNQAIEVGMMRAWLTDWGASTSTPERVMAWMHDGESMALDDMIGYATADQLRELSQAEGLAQGRMWLELMRTHHVGGVAMADVAVELASSDKVIRLAETQSKVQAYEISQYDLLLNGEYAAEATLYCDVTELDRGAVADNSTNTGTETSNDAHEH